MARKIMLLNERTGPLKNAASKDASKQLTVKDRLDWWKRRDDALKPEKIVSLDFANTLDWGRNNQRVEDLLNSYEGLIAWSKSRNLLDPKSVDKLLLWARNNPALAKKVFSRAAELRLSVYRIFSAIAAHRKPGTEDIEALNKMMNVFLPHLRIVSTDNRFEWDWNEQGERPDSMLWPIAKSATDLMTTGNLNRLGECENAVDGCSWLFFDDTKNSTRRWCHMEICGNRIKYWKRKHLIPRATSNS